MSSSTGGRLKKPPRSPHPEYRIEFKTKEGIYKSLKTHRYSKARGGPLLGKELSRTDVSVVSVKDMQGYSEWILFNAGREFFCYPFFATEKAPDLNHPVDKHSYRTSYPLSHDVNQTTRSVDSLDLVIGFNGGPLQRINPITKSATALYNSDRHIDPTDVTCVQWVPGSETHFISSHMSGNLYTWTTEHKYRSSHLPTFSTLKQFKDTTIYVSKPKNRFPVVHRWSIGHGPITAFAFSPDTTHLAVANQDGFLRIYNFHKMELYGRMRSYYGGFLCVCWSPDGKYVVVGGEDDLVSVWSFVDKRVVTRGEGHHSYVNAVTFDPYTSESSIVDLQASLTDNDLTATSATDLKSRSSRFFEESRSYRFGSVGQDGLMCLWELSGDNLTVKRRGYGWSRSRISTRQPSVVMTEEEGGEEGGDKKIGAETNRPSFSGEGDDPEVSVGNASIKSAGGGGGGDKDSKSKKKSKRQGSVDSSLVDIESKSSEGISESGGVTEETSSVSSDSTKVKKKPLSKSVVKKVKNLISGSHDASASPRHFISGFESCQSDDIAPKMSEINIVEPLVCKKVWPERLTDIIFREDCILVATEDGIIQLWARPGRGPEGDGGVAVTTNPGLNSPKPGGTAEAKHTSV